MSTLFPFLAIGSLPFDTPPGRGDYAVTSVMTPETSSLCRSAMGFP